MTVVAGALVTAMMVAGIVQAVSPRGDGRSILLPESSLATTGSDLTMPFAPQFGGPDPSSGAYPTLGPSGAPQSAPATAANSAPPAPPVSARPRSAPAAPPPAPTPRPAAAAAVSAGAYEAEDRANSRAGTWLRPVQGASGGYVIGYIGRGRSLQFTSVNVPAAGVYGLTIYYIAGDARDGTLLVNGRFAMAGRFPLTRDWNTVGSVTVPVRLAGGRNTISIGNDRGYAADIDRIVVR